MGVTTEPERFQSIDAIRGIAVMGILLMNILSFSMPSNAYLNPRAFGGMETTDVAAWMLSFILVDAKMRGLFSLLFGASMVLVIERGDDRGEDGNAIHLRRMAALAVIGLIHGIFIWYGDILFTYAVCGVIALFLAHKDTRSLVKWAIGLLLINAIMWFGLMGAAQALAVTASAPGADPELVKALADMRQGFGDGGAAMAKELAAYRGNYGDALSFRTGAEMWFMPLVFLVTAGAETVGLFALGMALFKNGFLTGAWDAAAYRRLAKWMYLIGLPPMIALAFWSRSTGFDFIDTATATSALALPFRPFVMLGHASLAMLVILHFRNSPWMARVTAAGRAALSNYLLTSGLMTTLFYGYGGGLFGQLSRAQVYAIVPLVWLLMLLWSKPWLDRYRYGPLEWLWRSMARGGLQTMHR
jgi:uncharacterized protein